MAVIVILVLFYLVYYFSKKANEKDAEIYQLKKIIYNLKTKLDAYEGKKPAEDAENVENAEKVLETQRVTESEEHTVEQAVARPVEKVETTMICSKCGKEVEKRAVSYCTECEEKIKEEQRAIEEKRKRLEEEKAAKREEESKTSVLLFAGSFFIILAAVVLLVSGWQVIPDIIKTTILALGVVLFLGGSKIAKEKMNIPKTAKTFFYIAMAYIPIFLISLCALGLLGDYFSLQGDGKYLYLGLSAIITALVYYWGYKTEEGRSLFYGSLLSQVGSVILITLMFAEDAKLVMINLLLYNLLLLLLLGKSKNELLFKGIFSIIPFAIGFFSLFLFNEEYLSVSLIYALLTINFIALFINNREDTVMPYFIVTSIMVTGIQFIMQHTIKDNNYIIGILSITYTVCAFIILMLLANRKKIMTNPVAIITALTIFVLGVTQVDGGKDSLVPLFVYGLAEIVIFLLSYKLVSPDISSILDFLIPAGVMVTGLLALTYYEVVYHFYIFFSLFVFMLGEIIPLDKEKNIKKIWFVMAHAFIMLTYLGVYAEKANEFSNDVIYFILLAFVYGYSYFRKANITFKYLGYISVIILLQSLGEALAVEEVVKVIFLVLPSVGILLLENKVPELEDAISPIFNNIFKIIVFIALFDLHSDVAAIISILYAIFLIVNNRKNIDNERRYEDVIPIVGVVPVLLGTSSLTDEFIIGMLSVAVVALTAYSIVQKKISIYTFASGAYLYLLTGYLHSVILVQLLFVIWSFVLWYFMDDEKNKDIFKFIGVCSIVALYNSLVKEVEANKIALFNYAGYIIADLYLFRTIIKKYYKDSDTLEAITLGLLYLIPISGYKDEVDGMLFTVLIVAIMIVSYFERFGTAFMVSIAALLVNGFLLTREFWLSLPWWFYLLVVGAFLVAFAGTNEARQSKGISISEKLKEFKGKIDGDGPKA